jgi:large subunit ribosomal protein L18
MLKKELGRMRRHGRIRKKMFGTEERPRLIVHRSLNNLYVQVIDDTKGHTLYSFSTQSKDFTKGNQKGGNVKAAEKLGQVFADQLKQKGIKKIAFDRGGYQYHGRIKALADSLRQAGIEF